jgi:hypothetical protein
MSSVHAPRPRHAGTKRALLGSGVAVVLALLAAAVLKPDTTPIDKARSARLVGQMEASQKQANRERAAEAERRNRLF